MKKVLLFSLFAAVTVHGGTLVETIQSGRLDESRREVIRPSEILSELSLQAGSNLRSDALWERLSGHIQATLTPQTQAAVRKQLESILLDKNGPALDYFPTVNLTHIPLIQQSIYLASQAAAPLAPKAPESSVSFQMDGRCTPSSTSHVSVVATLHVNQTGEPIDQAVESCYARNSSSLATVLNRLAEGPGGLRLVFARARSQRVVWVDSYSALLRALGAEGFAVEVFTKRTLVDFFGDTFAPPGKAPRDIRLVLWIRVPLPGGEFITVPAEHGDFGLLLTRDGKNRFAESRYFIGVPEAGQTSVSFWRPRSVKNAAWTESRLEFVKSYSSTQTEQARDWLESGAAALRAFKSIQKAYAFPASAYGYYICNDSVAVALAKYAKLTGVSQRLTHLFPLMRVTEIEKDSVVRPIEAEFARALGVSPEFLSDLYPSDPTLVDDLNALKQRLQEAYPATDKARFRYFPEALSELEARVW
jgi:hypothetical protein